MGLKKIDMAIVIFFWTCLFSFAAWVGPMEVLKGGWGSGSGDFGLRSGDTIAYDRFPQEFNVTGSGKVIIDDTVNKKWKIFNPDGTLAFTVTTQGLGIIPIDENRIATLWIEKATKKRYIGAFNLSMGKWEWKDMTNGHTTPSMEIDIQIVGGNIFLNDSGNYYKYTSTGTLLSTSTTRPPELGTVTERLLGLEADRKTRRYQVTIAYPDKTWTLITSTSVKGGAVTPVRDAQGNLNVIFNYTKRVRRYDASGNIVGEVIMPEDVSGPVRVVGLERLSTLGIEYGPPVVGSDGNVYCWARTPSQYKILKWPWQ